MAKVNSVSLFGATCEFSQVNIFIGSPSTGKSSLLNRIFLDAAVMDSSGDLVPASYDRTTDQPPREAIFGIRLKRLPKAEVALIQKDLDLLIQRWTGDSSARSSLSKAGFFEIRDSRGFLFSPSLSMRFGLAVALPAGADVVCFDDADAFLEAKVSDHAFRCMLRVIAAEGTQAFLSFRHDASVFSLIRAANSLGVQDRVRFFRLSRNFDLLEADPLGCSEIEEEFSESSPCGTFCKADSRQSKEIS